MIESQIISRLIELKPQKSKLYLVGGAVRDVLLQKQGKDFDLVCDLDTRKIARIFADKQHGAFYMLDPERNTSRVILTTPAGTRVFYDFARMHGDDITRDLEARDFTINAMALDLENPERLIDPLGGAADLKDRVLRICSESSFNDDPVRVIRAVRYAVDLDLAMTPATLQALKIAVPLVRRVSAERNRDEFFKVLETGRPDIGLQLLYRLKILEQLEIADAPELLDGSQSCKALETLFEELEGIGVRETTQALHLSSFVLKLGRFKVPLVRYLNTPNGSGRTRRTLDLLAVVMNHLPRNIFERSLTALSLSNDERTHLEAIFEHRNLLSNWSEPPDGRQIYRFFKQTQIDLCMLWLADLMAKPSAECSQDCWFAALNICEKLVEAWAEKPELVDPRPLINGNELMLHFDLTPGKQLGQLLDSLIEEQAAGTVTNREEALQWAANHIKPKTL